MSELSIAYHTLGCKLNFSETSTIARSFEAKGYTRKHIFQPADVYVINTCSVTENADKECAQLIRRVKKQNPGSKVVITGCYAQLQPEAIAALPGVDLVVGTSEKFNIAEHVEKLNAGDDSKICSCDIDEVSAFHSAYSLTDRTRTFLKVQDGCDYTCSFCTIPLARGHSRSDSIRGVMDNLQELEQSGVKEVVLTGVNIGDFGKGYSGNRHHEENFTDLVRHIDRHSGIPRFRISSIEPNLLTNEIIDCVADSGRFMPHFHIPLQSGSDRILGAMRRRYRSDLYADRVHTIRQRMPHACIGVDVIVGFPGETDEEFLLTYNFLNDLPVSYLHVFTYSERENTLAAEMPGIVPAAKRKERNAALRELSDKKMQAFTEWHRGQVRPVLFEQAGKDGMMEGFSDNYIKIRVPFREDYINQIIDIRI